MYASSVAEWRYWVRCAPCGVWAVRACGARERARARERERRAAERAAGRGGRERSGEGRGHRAERGRRERERERASPMVLHCVVGEEVAATFGSLEIRLGASLFVSLGAGGILSTTCDDYLLACP